MKFKDVECSEQGTSSVLNFTHPLDVWYVSLQYGYGIFGDERSGGLNTDVTSKPVNAPINIQKNESILLF